MAKNNVVSVSIADIRTYTYYGDSINEDGKYRTSRVMRVMLVVSERRNGTLAIVPYINGDIKDTVNTAIVDTSVTSNWDKAADEVAKKIFGKVKYGLQGVIEDFVVVKVPFKSAHRYGIRFMTPMNNPSKNVIANLCDYKFKKILYPDAPMKNYGELNITMGNRKGMYAFVRRQMTDVLRSEIYNNDPNSDLFDRNKVAIQGLADCCREPIKFSFFKYAD